MAPALQARLLPAGVRVPLFGAGRVDRERVLFYVGQVTVWQLRQPDQDPGTPEPLISAIIVVKRGEPWASAAPPVPPRQGLPGGRDRDSSPRWGGMPLIRAERFPFRFVPSLKAKSPFTCVRGS